jgi:hypothetical protein
MQRVSSYSSHLAPGFQWVSSVCRRHLAMPENGLVVTTEGLLTSAKRPGVLLNILQCTEQPYNKELSDPKCQYLGG